MGNGQTLLAPRCFFFEGRTVGISIHSHPLPLPLVVAVVEMIVIHKTMPGPGPGPAQQYNPAIVNMIKG